MPRGYTLRIGEPQVATLASYATWRTNVLDVADYRWSIDGLTETWQSNYYDRAYAWFFMNEADEISRAKALSETDLSNGGAGYHGRNNGIVPPRQMQPDFLVEYHLRYGTGSVDNNALVILENMANYLHTNFIYTGYVEATGNNWEGRIQERALLTSMNIDALQNDPSAPTLRRDYRANASYVMDQILAAQNVVGTIYNGVAIADTSHEMYGAWTPPPGAGSGGYIRQDGQGQASTNFMAVQAMAAMVRYVEYYDSIGDLEAGRRADVLAAIERGCDYLWDHNWDPVGTGNGPGFKYFSHPAGSGGDGISVDLNGLFPEVWGWLYNQTGLTKWRDQGDAIFDSTAVNSGGFRLETGLKKQYNQIIRGAWRYIYWRDGISLTHMNNPTEVHTP